MTVTQKNIGIAKTIINKFRAAGGTNIIGGLEVGLYLIKSVQQRYPGKYQPIMVFLTDGLPSFGITNTEKILSLVSKTIFLV